MTATEAAPHSRAAELRAAFDRSFAVAARVDDQVTHDLIAIRVGGEPFALRLADIAGLFADTKVTPVPGGHPAQLGLAGFRGALVPVFSLPALFGCATAGIPRWLVVASAAPAAFAFEDFERHLRMPAAAILPRQAPESRRGMTPEFVRTGDLVRPLIALPSVIDALGAPNARNSEPA